TPRGHGRNSASVDKIDQNLGYKSFLNGKLVSNIVIGTSVATDNTATSTRTVIVEAASTSTPLTQ
ncbi:MAG TPA: hypothetical protein VIK28_09365, partial [Sedimentisphaerales bacterium]